MPISTAAWGLDLAERKFLGGCAAQQSDRWARVALLRVSNSPNAGVQARRDNAFARVLDPAQKVSDEERIQVHGPIGNLSFSSAGSFSGNLQANAER